MGKSEARCSYKIVLIKKECQSTTIQLKTDKNCGGDSALLIICKYSCRDVISYANGSKFKLTQLGLMGFGFGKSDKNRPSSFAQIKTIHRKADTQTLAHTRTHRQTLPVIPDTKD